MKALTVISSHLANDRIEQLEGLVTKGVKNIFINFCPQKTYVFIYYLLFKALEEITKNLSTFSPSQKQQLRILLEDIVVCFARICIQDLSMILKCDIRSRSSKVIFSKFFHFI